MISNHNGDFPLQVSAIAQDIPQYNISYVRKTQDALMAQHVHNMMMKSPHILQGSNAATSKHTASIQLNSNNSEQNQHDPMKQIEHIKQKHSQKFKESHFTMERIGLNPSSYSSIVYKKPPNNCIHSIKEYISRNNIGFPQEFTYKQQPKQLQSSQGQLQQMTSHQQTQEQEASTPERNHPIQIESYSSIDKRHKLQIKRQILRNIEHDEDEYNKQIQEQLKEILLQRKKQASNQNTTDNPHEKNQQQRKKEHDKNKDQVDPLPPRYNMKLTNPQRLTLKTRIAATGLSTPINETQVRVFSPPKIASSYPNQSPGKLNKNDNLPSSPSPPPHVNNQQIGATQQLHQNHPKYSPSNVNSHATNISKDRKSDQLFDSIINKKNPVIVDGNVFNNIEGYEKKSNKLRYSKDDMNSDISQRTSYQLKNKNPSPLKFQNNFQKNSKISQIQQLQINQVQSGNIFQNDPSHLEINQSHHEHDDVKQKQHTANVNYGKYDSPNKHQINTNFLKIQNYGNKKQSQQQLQQYNQSNPSIYNGNQFDDSTILNNNSQSIVKIQQSSVNLPKQEGSAMFDGISKNQSAIINQQSQSIARTVGGVALNSSSVLLNSIVDYEDTYQIIQQNEVDKQNKANKYLSKLGLNNRYSKKDYLKVQNSSSINQDFLDINFDLTNLNPKHKSNNQSQIKDISSSQLGNYYNDNTQNTSTTLIQQQNSKKRSITTQPPHFITQVQSQNGIKLNEVLPLNNQYNQQYQQLQRQAHIMPQQEYNLKQKNKSVHVQSFNKDLVVFPKVASNNSPDLSRNLSILYQCEKERKNINYLTKKWELNIDKLARERSKYNQKFIQIADDNSIPENSMVYQYYQKQRFNTDF